MTDIEERLAAALRSVAGDAPPAAGLAGAARERRASRRRTTALASAGAVAAVVAVVGGVAMLGSSGGGNAQVADDPSPTLTATTRSGRVETWRDVSVTVPADWGYGNLSTWCLDGATEPGTPVVERPGGATALVLCNGPASGYGVHFSDSAGYDAAHPPGEVWQYVGGDVQMFPEGAWLGYQRSDDALVQVVAPSRGEVEQVLASFEHITNVDANGCAAHRYGPMPDVAEDTLRLCRYGMDDWLEQSETLYVPDAADAFSALNSAPARSPSRCPESAFPAGVRMWSADVSGLVRVEGCPGVFGWGGEERDLTSDVLYWVLSPGWSGGVEGDVPMPDQLRD